MKNKIAAAAFILLAVLTMGISIWGPEAFAGYQDMGILDEIHVESVETAGEGYRYQLNANEKLYLLSRCLNSRTFSQGEQSIPMRVDETGMYQELEGSYAFIANYRSPSEIEITDEQVYETCNEALAFLKTSGILPDAVKDVLPASYDATLYSAIDILEPRNNIAVWKLTLSNSQKNADKQNRLIDACLDAEDGKLYEFYVRTSLLWEEIDADAVVRAWADYMGLGSPEPYKSDNPLLETTPYFRKYVFPGMGEGRTIVTVGFYEGINELFLKISR